MFVKKSKIDNNEGYLLFYNFFMSFKLNQHRDV